MDGGTIETVDAEPSAPYPGSEARPVEILQLADSYREAALELIALRNAKGRRTRPAARHNAIHAIELYLNAFLSSQGETNGMIRSFQHRLGERTVIAQEHGLRLRRKTAEHMTRLDTAREYLVVRYAPERETSLSEVNRLFATLKETANKVHSALAK